MLPWFTALLKQAANTVCQDSPLLIQVSELHPSTVFFVVLVPFGAHDDMIWFFKNNYLSALGSQGPDLTWLWTVEWSWTTWKKPMQGVHANSTGFSQAGATKQGPSRCSTFTAGHIYGVILTTNKRQSKQTRTVAYKSSRQCAYSSIKDWGWHHLSTLNWFTGLFTCHLWIQEAK